MVLGITLVVLLLFAAMAEIHRSTWNVSSSIGAVTRNTKAPKPVYWSNVWVAPLQTTTSDVATGLTAAQLRQELQDVGIGATAAPLRAPSDQPGAGSVGMFLSLNEWEVTRTIWGWRAVAAATILSWPLAYDHDRPQVEVHADISAAGQYIGWLRRSTVERQLAEQLARAATNGIHQQLRGAPAPVADRPGQPLFGLTFSLRRANVTRSGEMLVTGVQHPLVMPGAKVNYFWDLPEKTVLAYRVTATAHEIEDYLLRNLRGHSPVPLAFSNSMSGSRQLVVPSVTHYPISGEDDVPLELRTERQVLIVID